MTVPGLATPSIRVPGLLPDDALQEQLKQFAASQNATIKQQVPTSAVDFADRIKSEFFDGPVRRATDAVLTGPSRGLTRLLSSSTATPEGIAAQQQAVDVRSDILSRSGILRPLLGPLGALATEGAPLARLGQLSPEEAEAEQQRRVEDAKADEQAVEATRQASRDMRAVTDTGVGVPVPPDMNIEAVKAARERGFDQQAAEAAEKTKAAEETRPTQTWWLNAIQNLNRGTTAMLSDVLRVAPIIAELASGSDQRSDVRAWVDTLDATFDKMLPGDKARSKDFMTQLSQGAGNMVGFMAAGLIATSIGVPATAATLLTGAAAGGAAQFQDAERFGAGGMQKLLSFLAGAALGSTEALPINRALYRMEQATGGLVSRSLQSTAASSMEEFLQELGQSIGEDVVAQHLYDEKREVDWSGALEQGLVGGVLGGLMGAATTGLREAGISTAPAAARTDPQEEAAAAAPSDSEATQRVEQLMADAQERFEAATQQMDDEATMLPPITIGPEGEATVELPEVAAQRAPAAAPEVVANELIERAAAEQRPATTVADDFVTALERPPVFDYSDQVQGRGGTVPAPDADGDIILRHFASQPREVLDPAQRGTGPLRGVERARLVGPEAVDRTYYGVYTGPDFREPLVSQREYTRLSPEERRAAARLGRLGVNQNAIRSALEARYRRESRAAGYRKEGGLGGFVHEVAVKPDDLYNIAEDPLGLREQLPDLTSNERVTAYERLIKEAGFKGAYFPGGELGQTAILFEPATPRRVVDERYGIPVGEIATPEDFQSPTAETFQKGGWAVVTGTQESAGPSDAPANVAANDRLRARLQRDKVPFIETQGSYQGTPQGPSFIVFAPEAYAKRLGAQYGQESVLTRRGLEYTDGRLVPALPAETVTGDAARQQDFYSELPSGEAFSIGLDFSGGVNEQMQAEIAAVQLDPVELEPLPGLTTGRPVESVVRAARAYAASRGLPVRRQASYVQADPERGARIAAAYEAMEHNPTDPAVAAAYDAMIEETLAQYQYVKATGLVVEAIEEGQADPYPEGPKQVLDDLERGHLWFFPTDQGFGSAIKLYHGTDADFDSFAPGFEGARDPGFFGTGTYFTADREVAEGYGERVVEADVRLKNPFEWDISTPEAAARTESALAAFGIKRSGLGPANEGNLANSDERRKFNAAVRAAGHDGVIVRTATRDIAEVVVFDASTALTDAAPDDNPLLRPTDEYIGERQLLANDVFRIVHDFFGHGIEGSGFGARGEENAWQSHMRLYSEAALPAVTSETRGQNSWVNFGPFGEQNRSNQRETVYADQKTGIMPPWTWTEGVADEFNAENMDVYAAQMASLLTGDYWAADELVETAVRLADPAHPLAAEVQVLGEVVMADPLRAIAEIENADRPFDVTAGRTAPGRSVAFAEGAAPAERAGDEAGRDTVGQLDAEAEGRADEAVEEVDDEPLAPAADLTQEDIDAFLGQRAPGDVTQTEAFKAWFGDSKVVDENGNPLVVYHGSKSLDVIREFKTGIGVYGQGLVWFSPSKRYAASYARPRFGGSETGEAVGKNKKHVIPVYLRVTNPFFGDLKTLPGGGTVAERLVAAGFDAYIPFEKREKPLRDVAEIAVVDPTQIKSVNNAGEFDPTNPDILAQTASNRAGYRAEQSRPQRGVAGQTVEDADDVSLTAIATNFTRLLDLTVRQGRFTLRGSDVMGQFSTRQGTVRLRTHNDLSTLVHEGAHALHTAATGELATFIKTFAEPLKKVAKSLYGGDVDSLPETSKVAEGFAEFVRVFVLNRPYAQNRLGPLTDAFRDMLEQHNPALLAGMESIAEQYEAWLQLPSAQVVRNMIVSGKETGAINEHLEEMREGGFGNWMHGVARRLVNATLNRNASLNDLVNDILKLSREQRGQSLDLKRADDPRVLIRLAVNNGARAMVQVTDGVTGYRSTTPMTRGLREALLRYHGLGPDQSLTAIDPVRQRDFAAYIVALRGIDEYRRLAEGKIERPPLNATLGDLRKTVKEMNDKYGPDFARAADIVHEFGMGLWEKAYQAGLVTKQTYKDGLERKFYAPLQRDMSDRQTTMSEVSAGSVRQGGSIVRRFRGSDRDIIDPMDALMTKAFTMERVIAENEVKLSLAKLADRAGRAGALVERIPAHQLLGQEYTVQEIARQLTKDQSVTEADAQDLMSILEASIEEGHRIALFRSQQALAKGENVLFFWEDGKLSAIQLRDGEVGTDIINTLNGIGVENMPVLVDLVAHTSTAFRSAITSWPDFLLVNFIRDQVSAWILTDVGYKPFVTGLRGVGDELRQAQWAKQYNAAMGIMGGINTATLHQARVDRDIAALRRKGYWATAFADRSIGGAIKGFARVTEMSETGTRLGLFRQSYEKAKADGLTDWEASVEAAYKATDYIDFGLAGNRMLIWRRLIPFLNATLQGLYKMMRTLGGDEVRQREGLRFVLRAYFKDLNKLDLSRTERDALRTGRKAWLKMASLGLIGAALHAVFRDDPDYQDASEYLRATGWVIPLGDGRIFYIPKPFELAIVSNFVERAFEHASGDGEALNRLLRGLAMNLTPPTSPPLVQVAVEQAANFDFFSGRDIVPDYMRALAPELQYNHFTTAFAKELGEMMGWSPMRVDHFMSGMGASAYRDLTGLYNSLDPNRPNSDPTEWPITRRFVRDARRGATSAQDFWAQASTVDGALRRGEVSYKRMIEEGRDMAASDFLNTLEPDARAYALLATHFKADAKRLNPFYRARQLTTIISAMRREMLSELGVEDTGPGGENIRLSASEKASIDDVLSEIARREVRNTMVYMQEPGWRNKRPLPVDPTMRVLDAIRPDIYDEFERRIRKANVYAAETVQDYWPEVRDRLLQDRENTFLKDIVSVAKVMR